MSRSQLQGKTFYCREWVFAKLGQMLEVRANKTPQGNHVSGLLLVGGPGAGKSAFCTELIWPTAVQGRQRSLSRRILAYHFCSAHEPNSVSVSEFIRRLVDQLAASHSIPGYAEKLRDPELEESLKVGNLSRDPDEAFKRAILFPLLEIDPPSQPCVLVVDSLDEPQALSPPIDLKTGLLTSETNETADADVSQSIAELLANHYHLFPPWLLVILTLRRQNKAMARLFTGFKKIALDEVRRGSVIRDVQQYILGRLENEQALRRHLTRETAPALNLLHIKSHGCLLYVETVLDGVADGSVLLRDIPEIPGTLNGLYLWLCQRLFSRRNWTKVQPLLTVLLSARRPPTEEELFRATWVSDLNLTREEFNKRLQMIRKLLVPGPESTTWLVFHSSFVEWLSDVKHCTQRFLVRVADGHARWAVALAARGEDISPQETTDLTFHLSRLNLQPPLEAWHLPLWLLWSKTPLPDQAALEVMVSSLGAQQSEDDDLLSPLEDWLLSNECVEGSQVGKMQEPVNNENEPAEVAADVKSDTEDVVIEPSEGVANLRSLEPCDTPITSLNVAEETEVSRDGSEGAIPLIERRDSFRYKLQEHSLSESEDPEQALFYAVELGYASAARKLIARYRNLLSPASIKHALSIAARQGHAPLVSILLDAGADPDSADSDGWTPLRAAAWGGHAATVQVLLQRGAQVDACDSEGRTALRAAAWAGHEEVVRFLLAAGAAVDGADRQGRTPLIAAAYMGHADIVTALLVAGAEPNHADCEGRTALSVAVLSVVCRTSQSEQSSIKPRRRVTGRLAKRRPSAPDENHPLHSIRRYTSDKKGTNPNVSNGLINLSNGSPEEPASPFECQTQSSLLDDSETLDSEAVETVAILLEYGANVNHQDKEGMTPLLVAAFEGHRTVCELLLEAEADVDQADQGGRTPLLAAASMGHASVVELLLFWGCYVDSIDAEGRTVLSVAAAQGSVDVVRRLLDRGLDEAHRDNAGWTPLHYAAFEGHPGIIDLLLEVGSRIDATDNDGRTPLLLAAQEGHLKAVERLIQAGSNVNQKSHDGKTPLRAAGLEGHSEVLSCLISAGADVLYRDADGRSTLYLLAIENKLTEVEIILKAGQQNLTYDRDHEGRSPLHVAAWQGHASMVELLIRYGADVNVVDREQRTPLQSAAWQGHEAVVWLLLQHGARVDQPCSQGATPLSIAAQEGHESVAKLLLASGADPSRADGCGRTALKLALKGGHHKVVQLLENWPITVNGTNSHCESMGSRQSAITGETKPSSALLITANQESISRDYSPSSTFETGLRSNTSSGKSSSNLTSSTTRSSQLSTDPNAVPHTAASPALSPLPPMSFTQQLQQQAGRGPRMKAGQLPLFPRVLSPLSEPQSPLYASPPPSSPQKEIINAEPIWQRLNQTPAKVKVERNSSYDTNGLKNGNAHLHMGLLRRERSDECFTRCTHSNPPVPVRTSSIVPDRSSPKSSYLKSDFTSKATSPSISGHSPLSFTQSSHMQIILGPPSKSRRNGLGNRNQIHFHGGNHGNSGLSGMLAGIRNSALLHGSSKLKNALCNAVTRPGVIPVKKETQL